ncbi:nuclear transport factor 2 family protein [Halopseudomonas bauzanensis]|uniref:Nuclear transport factor 2 family protein n=1 Tax=Halopseudomonas bauzanensis TaxID=653930 RepID=A0A4U0YI26_9GAMM|nr:nuclear transport factor 2 family protein [Halopseudomonas bauzanensis]TKA89686.1 nuclear transport factor 2 family protein [Halopseudomonas bauzanensis]
MSDIDNKAIESFLHGQIECWNSGDREGFFKHYRAVAANGLDIEYLGRPVMDGFPILENMWDQQNSKFALEVEVTIIAGNEAACHHKNVMRDGSGVIETIELYKFEGGRTSVRYFIKH